MSKSTYLILLLLFILNRSNGQSGETSLSCTAPGENCTYTPYNGALNLYEPSASYSLPSHIPRIYYSKNPLSSTLYDIKYINDDNYVEGSICDTTTGDLDTCTNTDKNLFYDVLLSCQL